MKSALLVILAALLSSPIVAQKSSVEQDFERERPRLSLVRFAVGEDATSGFDYLVYRRRAEIRKIRSVWNGGCCQPPRVEDFYYRSGSPVLYVRLAATRGQFRRLVRGVNLPLKAEEKLYFTNSKLTRWIENGRAISSSDPRWNQKEKDVLEEFKGQVENYQSYLDER